MFDHIHLLLQLLPDPLSLSYPHNSVSFNIPISLHCLFIVSYEAFYLSAPSLSEATLFKENWCFLSQELLSVVPWLKL